MVHWHGLEELGVLQSRLLLLLDAKARIKRSKREKRSAETFHSTTLAYVILQEVLMAGTCERLDPPKPIYGHRFN